MDPGDLVFTDAIASKSSNTPFLGQAMAGRAEPAIVEEIEHRPTDTDLDTRAGR